MSDQEVTGLPVPLKLMYDKKWKGKDISKIREREIRIFIYYKPGNQKFNRK